MVILLKWVDRCSDLWVCDVAGGAGGWAQCCVLGAGVGRSGCVGVVRGAGRRGSLACGWLNVRSPVLLDLYSRFRILDLF